ncbi:MAG: DNA polymerase III subunit [Oscillospiraceae bacterium]
MADLAGITRRLAAGGFLSHAYILSGDDPAARQDAAEFLAACYVCSGDAKPCHNCSGCHKAEARIHPDIVYLEAEEGKELTVAQVRALRSDAYIRPNEAPRKVYVIRQAEKLNIPAQNALLKVLEEGPPYAAFLLLCENPSVLLPTVISRCEVLRLAPGEGVLAEVSQQARENAALLAERLTAHEERGLVEYLASLEAGKWKREDVSALLDETIANLAARLGPENTHQFLPLIEALQTVRSAADSNVGPGHLLGYLAALTAEL